MLHAAFLQVLLVVGADRVSFWNLCSDGTAFILTAMYGQHKTPSVQMVVMRTTGHTWSRGQQL